MLAILHLELGGGKGRVGGEGVNHKKMRLRGKPLGEEGKNVEPRGPGLDQAIRVPPRSQSRAGQRQKWGVQAKPLPQRYHQHQNNSVEKKQKGPSVAFIQRKTAKLHL